MALATSNNIIDYIAGSQASAIVSGLSNVIQGSGVPSFIGSGTFNMMGIVPLGMLIIALPISPSGVGIGHVVFQNIFMKLQQKMGREFRP